MENNVKRTSVGSVIENLTPEGLVLDEAEKSEAIVDAVYTSQNETHTIVYQENTESGAVNTEITVRCGTVSVKRTGAVCSEFVFTEGYLHKSLYTVASYSFDTEIFTKKIRCALGENGGTLDIHYDMKIGGADKRVRMKIKI